MTTQADGSGGDGISSSGGKATHTEVTQLLEPAQRTQEAEEPPEGREARTKCFQVTACAVLSAVTLTFAVLAITVCFTVERSKGVLRVESVNGAQNDHFGAESIAFEDSRRLSVSSARCV